jgi:hypothetical protein
MTYRTHGTAARAHLGGALTALALTLAGALTGAGAGAQPVTKDGAGGRVDPAQVTRTIRGWHPAAQEAVRMMTAKYGPPAELTATMAVWGRTGPWKRTVVSGEAVDHAFPAPHPDVMEQVVDYRVPPELFDELAAYDGSVVVERTKGELSARCDKEGANFLALNLAHEIATGKRKVDDARKLYGEQIMAMKAGKPAPYTERLMFQQTRSTTDPDMPVMSMGSSQSAR